MSIETLSVVPVDDDGRWIYRVGGVSALTLGITYIAILPLFAYVGVPPTSGEVWLNYLQGKTTVWWIILWLCVLTDCLYIPVALALYVALERVNRRAMFLAGAFVALFVTLDLAVTWTNHASLLTLSELYAAAPNDIQRGAYVAAANYASAVLSSRLEVFYAIVVLSLGIFIASLVMWKQREVFSRTTVYLGLATGISGSISIGRFFVAFILNVILTMIWLLFVGVRLLKLAKR